MHILYHIRKKKLLELKISMVTNIISFPLFSEASNMEVAPGGLFY